MAFCTTRGCSKPEGAFNFSIGPCCESRFNYHRHYQLAPSGWYPSQGLIHRDRHERGRVRMVRLWEVCRTIATIYCSLPSVLMARRDIDMARRLQKEKCSLEVCEVAAESCPTLEPKLREYIAWYKYRLAEHAVCCNEQRQSEKNAAQKGDGG
jgi:hypothetical protein